MTDTQRAVVLAMAKCNMVIGDAAKEVYLHRNTIDYHRRRMIELYGLDIKNFYDLVELVRMVERPAQQ